MSSSTSPSAAMRAVSLPTREPSPRPVLPSSPVRVAITDKRLAMAGNPGGGKCQAAILASCPPLGRRTQGTEAPASTRQGRAASSSTGGGRTAAHWRASDFQAIAACMAGIMGSRWQAARMLTCREPTGTACVDR
ncbi:Uncharacterised protein [Bordetella pertussis]|nr:Uncharacterised protein [Bordetella pertussis]